MTKTLLLLALGLFLAHAPGHAADPGAGAADNWPRFRGPNGDGLSPATRLPVTWGDREIRWQVSLPGKGHSSPVVWGDYLFVTTSDEPGARRTVLCLKTKDGTVVWRRDSALKTYPQHRDNNYAASTPAVDEDRVYVYWTTPAAVTLLALDRAGREVWQRELGPFASQHGSGTSPVVVGDLVVVSNDQDGRSALLGLDRKTGATRWESPRRTDRAAFSTPCLYRPAQGPAELVFTSTSHGLSGLDPATGRVLWEYPKAFPLRVVGSPVSAAGLLVATCGEGGTGKRLVAVRPGTANPQTEPQLVFELKTQIPYVPTPICHGDRLFLWGDNGLVTCLRPSTGARVWQEKLEDTFFGSPVWANGRLYAMAKTGKVYVLAAADRFELLGQTPLGEASFATPAIAGEVLYLRTESRLFAVASPAPRP